MATKSRRTGRAAARRGASRPETVAFACPRCGARYALPPDRLDRRVQCSQCRLAFTPRAHASRGEGGGRRRKKGGIVTAVAITGGLGVAVAFVYFLLSSLDLGQPPGAAEGREVRGTPQRERIGFDHPVAMAVRQWLTAIGEDRQADFFLRTDMESFHNRRRQEEELPYRSLRPAQREEAHRAILRSFHEGEDAAPFRDLEVVDAWDEAFEPGQTARVQFAAYPRGLGQTLDPRGHHRLAVLEFELVVRDDIWRVADARMVSPFRDLQAEADAEKEALAEERRRRRAERHPEITGFEVVREGEDEEGRRGWVLEADPVPLGHLDDTPPALRQEIDTLLSRIKDLTLRPPEISAAQTRLREIGRPAIPRLLNTLHEVPADTRDNRIRLRQAVMVLRDVTGQYFGFEPLPLHGAIGAGGEADSQEALTKALRQWYAWWYRNHDREVPGGSGTSSEER